MEAYRTQSPRDLGPLLSRHFPRRWGVFGWLSAAVMFLAVPIVAVGAPLTGEVSGGPDLYALIIFALVVPLAVAGIVAHALRHFRDEVALHEQGCVQRLRRGETALAWDDVVACRTNPISVGSPPPLRESRFDLVLRDGARVSIPPDGPFFDFLPAVTPFAPAIRAAVDRVLLRSAREAFERGEAIRFSDLEARPGRGLWFKGSELPWSELAGMQVDEGRWIVILRRPRVKWAVLFADSIDNLDLLLVLVENRGVLPV
jgi:hypothetical protein